MFFSLPALRLSPYLLKQRRNIKFKLGSVAAGSRCKQMVHCIMPLHFHVDKNIKYHIFTNDISWTRTYPDGPGGVPGRMSLISHILVREEI